MNAFHTKSTLIAAMIFLAITASCRLGPFQAPVVLTERQLAADPSLQAGADSTVLLFLEPLVAAAEDPSDPDPEEPDTGTHGVDSVGLRLEALPLYLTVSGDAPLQAVLMDEQENELGTVGQEYGSGVNASLHLEGGDYVLELRRSEEPGRTLPVFVTISRVQYLPDDGEPFEVLQIDVSAGACIGCMLEGIELPGARFRGVDLTAADLAGADLSGADLIEVCLRDADLTGADCSNSWLYGADMRGAVTDGADFTGVCYEVPSSENWIFGAIGLGLAAWKFYKDMQEPSASDLMNAINSLSDQVADLASSMKAHFEDLDRSLKTIYLDMAEMTDELSRIMGEHYLLPFSSNLRTAEVYCATHLDTTDNNSATNAARVYDFKFDAEIFTVHDLVFTGNPDTPDIVPLIERQAKAEVFNLRNSRRRDSDCDLPCTRRPLPADADAVREAYNGMAFLYARYTFLEMEAISLHRQALMVGYPAGMAQDFMDALLNNSNLFQEQSDAFIQWVEYLVLNSIDWQDPQVSSGLIPQWAQDILGQADLLVAQTMGVREYGVRGRRIYLSDLNECTPAIREAGGSTQGPMLSGLVNEGEESAGIEPDPLALYSEAVSWVDLESPDYTPFNKASVMIDETSVQDDELRVYRRNRWYVQRLRAPLSGDAATFDLLKTPAGDGEDVPGYDLPVEPPLDLDVSFTVATVPVRWYGSTDQEPVEAGTDGAQPYGYFLTTDRLGFSAMIITMENAWTQDWFFAEDYNCDHCCTFNEEGSDPAPVDTYENGYCKDYSGNRKTAGVVHRSLVANKEHEMVLTVDSSMDTGVCNPYEHMCARRHMSASGQSPVVYFNEPTLETTRIMALWSMELHGIDGEDNGAFGRVALKRPECLEFYSDLYHHDYDGGCSDWHCNYSGAGTLCAPPGAGVETATLYMSVNFDSYHQREYNTATVTLGEIWIDF